MNLLLHNVLDAQTIILDISIYLNRDWPGMQWRTIQNNAASCHHTRASLAMVDMCNTSFHDFHFASKEYNGYDLYFVGTNALAMAMP